MKFSDTVNVKPNYRSCKNCIKMMVIIGFSKEKGASRGHKCEIAFQDPEILTGVYHSVWDHGSSEICAFDFIVRTHFILVSRARRPWNWPSIHTFPAS